MSGYVVSKAAVADLASIWRRGEDRWGSDQADSYIGGVQRAIGIIAADPRRGRPCDDLRLGYRKFAVGTHMLFFRIRSDGIEIVRVLHQRMDFSRYL